MLQKTMVVVEGVARKLNPNTNIWTTSKPVLENWLKETKDPMTTIKRNSPKTLLKLLKDYLNFQKLWIKLIKLLLI